MKVLIIANDSGGLYSFRMELIKTLIDKGNTVYICLPEGNYIPDLIKIGCIFEPCNFDRHGTNLFDEFKIIRHYKMALKKIEPDIVFTYTIKPNIYGCMACKSRKIPCVVNVTGLGTALENPGILQKITLLLYKFAL